MRVPRRWEWVALGAVAAFFLLGAVQDQGWLDAFDARADALISDGLRHEVGEDWACRQQGNTSICSRGSQGRTMYSTTDSIVTAGAASHPANATWTQTIYSTESMVPWTEYPSNLGTQGGATALALAAALLLVVAGRWRAAAVAGGMVLALEALISDGRFSPLVAHGAPSAVNPTLFFAATAVGVLVVALRALPSPPRAKEVLLVWLALTAVVALDLVHIGERPFLAPGTHASLLGATASQALRGWLLGGIATLCMAWLMSRFERRGQEVPS